MRKLTNLLLLVAATCLYSSLNAQNQDDMKAMMAYMTPGEIHQMMAKSSGSWNGAITMWSKPGDPPSNATCEAKSEMILGGRYLQVTNTGNMLGMPFEGIGVTGYDNAKKVFVNSWIDNFGTGMIYMEGTWDDQNKAINFTGKMVDPLSGRDQAIREVMKFVDDNTQVIEMYGTDHGQEYKTMEIKYTRKS